MSLLPFLTCFLTFIILCFAGDGDNLYDVCPTDTRNHNIFINGYPCKNTSDIIASDFKSSLLNEPGDTDNFYRSSTILATAAEFPGLNTLGLSVARTDIEVDGTVMPHAHPRASEMIFVRAGSWCQNPGMASISGAMFGSNAKEVIVEKLKSLGMRELNGISTFELFGE
ncbi:hypothetical protein DH2020_013451 [Rehmannia glutinosa]|uniref:Cupin type-1 domain-containing protein n=1 Tax=Rehmannia glutinosa TaxID=99300 RepID=A0ABR0X2A6_REHGL